MMMILHHDKANYLITALSKQEARSDFQTC